MVLARLIAVVAAACVACGGSTAPPTTSAPPSKTSRSTSASVLPTAATTSRPVTTSPATAVVPAFAHVVVVMMENHSYAEIHGNTAAPYLNSLMSTGASFTASYAVTHPSQPNYVALFSGSTQGLTDDSCPHSFSAGNLGASLAHAGHSFAAYSEGLPATGSTVCTSGAYARKHDPWTDFPSVPASANRPFTAFGTNFATLPALSFVIPNLNDDMHDGTIAAGDAWLRAHLGAYRTWAQTHDSLLVVTWDEDDHSASNQIPTVFAGAHVKPGRYGEHMNHYRVLRTLEAMFALTPLGASAQTTPITDVWQ